MNHLKIIDIIFKMGRYFSPTEIFIMVALAIMESKCKSPFLTDIYPSILTENTTQTYLLNPQSGVGRSLYIELTTFRIGHSNFRKYLVI